MSPSSRRVSSTSVPIGPARTSRRGQHHQSDRNRGQEYSTHSHNPSGIHLGSFAIESLACFDVGTPQASKNGPRFRPTVFENRTGHAGRCDALDTVDKELDVIVAAGG